MLQMHKAKVVVDWTTSVGGWNETGPGVIGREEMSRGNKQRKTQGDGGGSQLGRANNSYLFMQSRD